eukprot:9412930-Lingulodinium_polyedra.AAC.1
MQAMPLSDATPSIPPKLMAPMWMLQAPMPARQNPAGSQKPAEDCTPNPYLKARAGESAWRAQSPHAEP